MMKKVAVVVLLFVLIGGLYVIRANTLKAEGSIMQLWSEAFQENGMIPKEYACNDDSDDFPGDIVPAMQWQNVPAKAQSLVFICDDPDAGAQPWVHLVVFNVAPNVSGWPKAANLTEYGIVGKNSWHKNTFAGPCPPSGTHHYYFKLYALDIKLNLDASATAQAIEREMEGHVLGHAQLVGLYSKST